MQTLNSVKAELNVFFGSAIASNLTPAISAPQFTPAFAPIRPSAEAALPINLTTNFPY